MLGVVPDYPCQGLFLLLGELWCAEGGADVLGDGEEDETGEFHQGWGEGVGRRGERER